MSQGGLYLSGGLIVVVTSPHMSDLLVSPEALAVVLGQTVVVVQPALLTGVRVPPSPHLLLLLLAVVLHVFPQTARVRVLLLAARHLALVGLLAS